MKGDLRSPVYRIVVVGDESVGKTSMVNTLISQVFNENEPSTVGSNFQSYISFVDSRRIELQIWDTAGQEKYRALGPIYYRNSLGAIVVFSLTSHHSFESLQSWINGFRDSTGENTLVYIAANKSDLEDAYEVDYEQAVSWAESHGYKIFRTSAKTKAGVNELFDAIASDLYSCHIVTDPQIKRQQLEPGKSSCC